MCLSRFLKLVVGFRSREPSGSFWELLGASGSFLGSSGSLLSLLEASGNPLGASGSFWGPLEAFWELSKGYGKPGSHN